MKPISLFVGAPMPATTSLRHDFGQHPEVFFSHTQEAFFFCCDDVNNKQGGYWFETLFDEAEGDTAIGEGSTINASLGTYPNALPRPLEHAPEAKIIDTVREPVRRIESYGVDPQNQATITTPFNRADRQDPKPLDTGLYRKGLSASREHFEGERNVPLFLKHCGKPADICTFDTCAQRLRTCLRTGPSGRVRLVPNREPSAARGSAGASPSH